MPKFTDKFIATLKGDGRHTSDTDTGFQIKVEKYVGRTPHIRVKISAGQSELTTQLHLPNQRSNYSDNFFDKKPQIQNTSEGFIFDFIVG